MAGWLKAQLIQAADCLDYPLAADRLLRWGCLRTERSSLLDDTAPTEATANEIPGKGGVLIPCTDRLGRRRALKCAAVKIDDGPGRTEGRGQSIG